MSIGYAYYCDGPECEAHTAVIATPPPYLPYGFIEARQMLPGAGEERRYFCSWDCAMKYAAQQPVAERIDLEPGGGDGA